MKHTRRIVAMLTLLLVSCQQRSLKIGGRTNDAADVQVQNVPSPSPIPTFIPAPSLSPTPIPTLPPGVPFPVPVPLPPVSPPVPPPPSTLIIPGPRKFVLSGLPMYDPTNSRLDCNLTNVSRRIQMESPLVIDPNSIQSVTIRAFSPVPRIGVSEGLVPSASEIESCSFDLAPDETFVRSYGAPMTNRRDGPCNVGRRPEMPRMLEVEVRDKYPDKPGRISGGCLGWSSMSSDSKPMGSFPFFLNLPF